MTLHFIARLMCIVKSLCFLIGNFFSETLILASTNPQYDNILFIELRVQYITTSSVHVVYINCQNNNQFLYTTSTELVAFLY